MLSNERETFYTLSELFCVTPRILIVDMLDGRISLEKVGGIVVFNAHRFQYYCILTVYIGNRLQESSVEAFIIKVFKEKNRNGFVRGFSDDPEALQQGFGKAERVLRMLYVKKMFLWPRFRSDIEECMKQRQAEVVELSIPMQASIESIQDSLLVIVNSCLSELKKTCPTLDASTVTLSSTVLTGSFDFSIRSQLDSEWHRLSPRTKQLVADLTTVRKLFEYALQYDACSFCYLLQKVRAATADQAYPSLWLSSAGADQLFKRAKERAYTVLPETGSLKTSGGKVPPVVLSGRQASFKALCIRALGIKHDLQPTLECPSKWKLLRSVLKEIAQLQEQQKRTVVIVRDAWTRMHLTEFLRHGEHRLLMQRYRWFARQMRSDLTTRMRLAGAQSNLLRPAARNKPAYVKPSAVLQEAVQIIDAANYSTDEGMERTGTAPAEGSGSKVQENGSFLSLGLSQAQLMRLPMEEALLLIYDELFKMEEPNGAAAENLSVAESSSSSAKRMAENAEESGPKRQRTEKCEEKPATSFEAVPYNGLQVLIVTHSEVKESPLLFEQREAPFYVVYDPDVHAMRALEFHKACSAQLLKVYFLSIQGSVEQQRYQNALEREQRAFTALIELKSHLVVSLPDHPDDLKAAEKELDSNLSLDSRSLRRSLKQQERRKVIVDVREFRSSLPSMLYSSGFELVPRTLTVGDYVLSPEICVERKGIQDLFQSFASGRLYNQVEAMCKHYKYPTVLIEFSGDKPFLLVEEADLSAEIAVAAIQSKLVLLAMTFPSVRFLWSRSSAMTVDMLKTLVANHDQVDVEKALSAGLFLSCTQMIDGGDQAGSAAPESESSDLQLMLQDILLCLPGVNVYNYRELMRRAGNLATLVTLSVAELSGIVGPTNAPKLFAFLHENFVTK